MSSPLPSATASPPPPPSPPEEMNSTTVAPAPSAGVNNTSFSTPSPPTSNSTALPDSGSALGAAALVGMIVGIVIGGLFVLIGVCICVICYRRKKRKKLAAMESRPPQEPKDESKTPPQHFGLTVLQRNDRASALTSPYSKSDSSVPLGFSQITFTYEELADATNGFSSTNLLGQGGYGYVHKGVLPNGKVVAVKQLKPGSGQGEREFQAEVEIISRIHHRHLVSLVGYCISGEQRMLVYEFVPNDTLEFHLHGKERPTMSWTIRMRIALGSAKGLTYLHEDCRPKIIHRDIKAANILLDFGFEAKVADFGLAKFSEDTDTHVSTRVMGTFGYLAPEYASSGKLTDKSDVFSFGVVLLELITGRRPVDRAQPFADDSGRARPLLAKALENNDFEDLIDPKLGKEYEPSEMARMIACAAASIRQSARLRPKMSQIVRALEGNLALHDLNGELPPGHSMVYNSPFGSSDYDSSQYEQDLLEKFRKAALESTEMTTSEFSGPTSEFGARASSSSNEIARGAKKSESGNGKKEDDAHVVTGSS